MRIINATLVKRKTDDGNMEMEDHVPLGKVYKVDLDQIQTVTYFNPTTGQCHKKDMIIDIDAEAPLPLELLKFEDT